jgi:hypothetical protein
VLPALDAEVVEMDPEENALTLATSKEQRVNVPLVRDGFVIESVDELFRVCVALANGAACPQHLKDPGSVMLIVMTGIDLGLSATQAIMQINIIKGKIALPGKVKLALIQASPLCTDYRYNFEGEGDALMCWVKSTRAGRAPNERVEFSMQDARVAGLLSNDTYKKYPKDMLLWKAVSRDADRNWGDVTLNLPTAEMVRVEGRGAPRGLPEPEEGPDPMFELEGGE